MMLELILPASMQVHCLDGISNQLIDSVLVSGRWGDVGVFVRYSAWDERNRISGSHRFEKFEQFTTGVNWWPHNNVVLKFDTQWEDADGTVNRILDGINVGLGYQF